MCALCGGFGAEDQWAVPSAGQTRRAARLARVRAANAVLGVFALRLDDWQGAAFVLASATGRREIVDHLPQVWDAAARMLGRRIDPLDPALLARIAARAAT